MRDVRIEINTLTADLFLQLFASVGMVRLLGDGGMSFYL